VVALPVPLVIVAVLVVWQQLPPRDTPPPSVSTAAVRGRVVEHETGQPLRGAAVQLILPVPGGRRVFEASTDADGRFEFPSVPAGAYFATAAPGEYRAGHQLQNFSADGKPPRANEPSLMLKAGETRTDVNFALPRTFAIEGRIVSEYGDGLANVSVSVERMGRGGIMRTLRSDDRGQFRLYGLPPGEYRVCGSGDAPSGDRLGGSESPQTRYVRTCLPPANAPGGGIPIKAADAAVVDIQMQRAGAFSVSGRVLDESGAPVDGGSIQIFSTDEVFRSGSVEYSRGSFVARGVTPGEYAVRAMVYDAAPSGTAPPLRAAGNTLVRVDASDVTDVLVVLRKGVDVSGHVLFKEGPPPPPTAIAGPLQAMLRFDVASQAIYRMEPIGTGVLRADHTFEVKGVRGPRIVGLAGLPPGWVVESVRYRGTNITDVPTEFAMGTAPKDLEIVATSRAAQLAARTVDEKGEFVENAVAFLLPTDPSKWHAGPIPLPLVRETDGTARPRAVRPGEYFVAALRGDEYTRLSRSLDLMKALAAMAARVTLAEGDVRALQVTVLTLSGAR